uniref:Biogenesis of lysosome-related organelles complex 1 subunit 2 n=1 Tax=Caenorhabditis tropicalis TaxID=1561998 RepID=A0A1I7TTG6_9PELO
MSDVERISSNIKSLIETTAGITDSVDTNPINIVLEKCTVVLEELRTIQILSETHSEGLTDQLKQTEKSITEMENLFDKVDKLSTFVQQAKAELDGLEKLYNVVDRQ